MSDSRCSSGFLDETQYDERGRPIRKTRAIAPRYKAPPAPRGGGRRVAPRMPSEEREQKIAEERQKFDNFFPNEGVDMFTGMGKEIGKDRPKMKFISSLEFNSISTSRKRHYLLKWEGQNGNVPEVCWTNGDNIDDHRSGLQEYFDDVTLTRLEQCMTEYNQKIDKKNATIARLRKERDEARADLQRAREAPPHPNLFLETTLDFGEPERASTPISRDDLGNSAVERSFSSLSYPPSTGAHDDAFPRQASTPAPHSVNASAGAKRVLSSSWQATPVQQKVARMDPAFHNSGFANDTLDLFPALERFDSIMNASGTSSNTSMSSERGRPKSVPSWLDTTGWSRFKLTNLGNKIKRLRRANDEMSDGHFRDLVL